MNVLIVGNHGIALTTDGLTARLVAQYAVARWGLNDWQSNRYPQYLHARDHRWSTNI